MQYKNTFFFNVKVPLLALVERRRAVTPHVPVREAASLLLLLSFSQKKKKKTFSTLQLYNTLLSSLHMSCVIRLYKTIFFSHKKQQLIKHDLQVYPFQSLTPLTQAPDRSARTTTLNATQHDTTQHIITLSHG